MEQHSVLATDRLRDLKEDMINLNEKVDNLTEKIIKDRLGLLDGSRNEDMIKIEHGLDQVKYLLQQNSTTSGTSSNSTARKAETIRVGSDAKATTKPPRETDRYSPKRSRRSNSRKRSSDKSKSSRGSSSCRRAGGNTGSTGGGGSSGSVERRNRETIRDSVHCSSRDRSFSRSTRTDHNYEHGKKRKRSPSNDHPSTWSSTNTNNNSNHHHHNNHIQHHHMQRHNNSSNKASKYSRSSGSPPHDRDNASGIDLRSRITNNKYVLKKQ